MNVSGLWGTPWSAEPLVGILLLMTAGFYLRGFARVRRQSPQHFPAWRRNAFLTGLILVYVSIASPLDALADLLFLAHMVQHWLLMMVIPPLVWLGAPTVPLLRGLPGHALSRGVGPLLASPGLIRGLRFLTNPGVALALWILVTLAWHWPPAYEWALTSPWAHNFEHVCFLSASLLLWFRILEPWPTRRSRGFGSRLLLVAAAALFNSIFSAGFAFSETPLYPFYAEVPNPWSVSVMADQNAAGAFMWIAASLPMIAAVVGLTLAGLSGPRLRPLNPAPTRDKPTRAPLGQGAWIGSRKMRRGIQWLLAGLALVVVLDGLLGPSVPSSENLAGVLPWTYWRGMTLVALALLGNFFCAVCPFTLSRNLSARLLGRPFRWPGWLRNRWLSAALFLLYLWSYEVFELWDRPMATAAWIIGFFLACFWVEGLFPRGTFCRYVCPIGQFQFVHASLSPREVQSLSAEVCAGCTTHDCLRGNAQSPGCPTELYLPAKVGNLDCTFCLDCVRACPHDNAGLVPVWPGRSLGSGRVRGQAPALDLAFLSGLFVWGAFVNAMAMSAPFLMARTNLLSEWGVPDSKGALSVSLVGALLVFPLIALPLCAGAARWFSGSGTSARGSTSRLIQGLVPLGFAMWLAHFGFHLATGLLTALPASQRVLHDLVPGGFGPPESLAASQWSGLVDAQLLVLGAGLVVSIAVLWRLSRGILPEPGKALRLVFPWSLLAFGLWGLGVVIYLSPMQMRGTGM